MNSANSKLGISLIFCGLLFIGLSVPLLKGSIRMNRWYGFRIRKAFESEENWYKINKYGAQRLIIWSLAMIITGVVYFFLEPRLASAIGIWPLGVFTLIPIIETLLYAKRL